MISLKKINKQTVKAIPIPNEDTRPIKGFKICEEVYANIFLCAKKKSGKTSAIFKIIKECSNKDTIIIIFCSTVYKDKNWIQMRKHFEKKNEIRVFTSIYEDGEDQLHKLINDLNCQAQENKNDENNEKESEELEIDRCDDIIEKLKNHYLSSIGKGTPKEENEDAENNKKKQRKSKHRAPEYIIVFDDLSTELKSRSLLDLLKKNRHYKTKLIISSQWVHDLLPESRKQIDLFLIFKGFSDAKMKELYKDSDSSIPFETFIEVYKKATELPYSFLYVDTRSDSFRCCFDKQFIL